MGTKKTLELLSYNVRGLKDKHKRYATFSWLREKKCDMILLQETHCHLRKDETSWGREWGGQCFWSKGTARSKGVAIMFKPGIKYDIENILIDANGRYIILQVKIDEAVYQVVNIYAPNDEYERVNFFNLIMATLGQHKTENMETIIGGDYNCVLNSELDRKNCTANQEIGQQDVKYMMDVFELEDVWRRRNPKKYALHGRGEESSPGLIIGLYLKLLITRLKQFT